MRHFILSIFTFTLLILSLSFSLQADESASSNKQVSELTLKWQFTFGASNRRFDPIICGHTLYLTTESRLWSIDVVTGKKKWTVSPQYEIQSSPAEDCGVVVILTGGKNLILAGFASESGKKLWAFKANGSYYADGYPMIVHHNLVYFQDSLGSIYVIDIKTGKPKWCKMNTHRTQNVSLHPIVCKNTVAWIDGKIYVADSVTGKLKWQKAYGEVFGLVSKMALLISPKKPVLSGVDVDSGKTRWQIELQDQYYSGIAAVTDNMLYICRNSKLCAVDIDSGRDLWQFEMSDMWPLPSTVRTDTSVVCLVTQLTDGTKGVPQTDLGRLGAKRAQLETPQILCGIDIKSGKLLWKQRTVTYPTTLAIHDGLLVFSEEEHGLSVVDAKTGKRMWYSKYSTSRSEDIVFIENTLVIVGQKSIYALDLPGMRADKTSSDMIRSYDFY